MFTIDDYFDCYFSGYDGEKAHIGNAVFSPSSSKTIKMNYKEWKSLKITNIWDLENSSQLVYRLISYIDKFNDLILEMFSKSYRIPMKDSFERNDYDIISKSFFDDKIGKVVNQSVFYFKTSNHDGYYSSKTHIILFEEEYGNLQVDYIPLFPVGFISGIEEIFYVDCFYRGKRDLYCIVNAKLKTNSFIFYLLKYTHSNEYGAKFIVKDYMNESGFINEGVINVEKIPNLLNLKQSQKSTLMITKKIFY